MPPSDNISLNDIIQSQYTNIAGVVVLKKNNVVYEYHDNDEPLRHSIHIASVTKSIISTLIGIAIDKGFINTIDDNVIAYFPHYRLKRGEKTLPKITIRQLLTMTAPYKYKYEPYTKVYSSDDWTTATLDLLGGKNHNGDFKYTTVGMQVLSGILVQATEQSVLQFANEYLFQPLNIAVSENIRIADKDAYFSFIKNNDASGWVVDPKGIHTGGWGLTLTASDMAKIGQLYLNQGQYNNINILSSRWVQLSTKPQSMFDDKVYGLLWWVINEDQRSYAAIGDSGNIIYVSEEYEIVISIASHFKPRAKDRFGLIENILKLFH